MILLRRNLRYLGILQWSVTDNRLKYFAQICFIDGILMFQIVSLSWFYWLSEEASSEVFDCLFALNRYILLLLWHVILVGLRKKYEELLLDLDKMIQSSE